MKSNSTVYNKYIFFFFKLCVKTTIIENCTIVNTLSFKSRNCTCYIMLVFRYNLLKQRK